MCQYICISFGDISDPKTAANIQGLSSIYKAQTEHSVLFGQLLYGLVSKSEKEKQVKWRRGRRTTPDLLVVEGEEGGHPRPG